ncbi:MAG: hypothetical protein WEA24_14985, partial [Gemmatimonadota bacterium]
GGRVPPRERGAAIEQVYLSPADPQVRIRKVDGRYVQTVKEKATRMEVEFPLQAEVGRALFELAITAPIRKTRFVEGPWEIDVFHGRFDGLVYLEIEDPPRTLPPVPGWVEVVGPASAGNVRMATMNERSIRALVARSR